MAEVTNEEIAAVAEGSADKDIERRVLAAALLDISVRDRLNLLRSAENTPSIVAEVAEDAAFAQRAQNLKNRMAEIARQVSTG